MHDETRVEAVEAEQGLVSGGVGAVPVGWSEVRAGAVLSVVDVEKIRRALARAGSLLGERDARTVRNFLKSPRRPMNAEQVRAVRALEACRRAAVARPV